jgi:hypothetical protein
MISQNKIHNEILDVKAETEALLKKDPSDDRLKFVVEELERLAELVNLSWPFAEEDKQNVIIGLYAVREIEDSNPDLAVRLTHIAYDLKHS